MSAEVVVTAKCMSKRCGTKVELRAGDVAPGDHPMCPKCYLPLIASRASVKRKPMKKRAK